MYNHLLKSYQQVLERQSKLDYAGTIKSSLIHEVKNSLTVIQGGVQIMPELQELTPKSKQVLEQIQIASDQLHDFVKGYQTFLKTQNMNFVEKPLMQVVKKALLLCELTLQNQKYTIEVDIPRNLTVNINEAYILQVFVNLIKNSIEATPSETERLQLQIKAYLEQDKIYIDFIDRGTGINKEEWETVFYPFHSNKEKGTGLGLPYCKQILLAHRGDINIVRSDDSGTHIQLCLPLYPFST
ncbi:sensor histidine kinase [Bacillus pinisoli]|uniref:sensor histidine kinase n=1 Tax=Bacillus pinisoli TaxID=2901866 RepID=UPI001FF69342|nr:HAMP domain-containing sensor histidine kinase [Bacillus pinisoli]